MRIKSHYYESMGLLQISTFNSISNCLLFCVVLMSFQIFIWSTKYFCIYVWLDSLEDFIQSIYSTCDSSMDIFSLLLDGDGCCLQLTTSVESILPKMEIEKRVSTVRNDEMDF